MKATVENIVDWTSENGDDQIGHTKVTTPTGYIFATWKCEGGMGGGVDVLENTTDEFDDDEAWQLLDSPSIYWGHGVYAGEIERDRGHFDLVNVDWVKTEE